MSIILSLLTVGGITGLKQLSQLSVVASLSWFFSTRWLGNIIPRKAEAQAAVESQQRKRAAMRGKVLKEKRTEPKEDKK